jgi:hypothetical protein
VIRPKLLSSGFALLAAGAALAAGPAPTREGPEAAPALLITGATVVDGTGAPPVPESFVMIQGGRFTDVSTMARRRGMMTLSKNVRVLDGSGKWMIPGIVDAGVRIRPGSDAAARIRWGVTTAEPGEGEARGSRLRDVPVHPMTSEEIASWAREGVFAAPELSRAQSREDPAAFLDRALSDRRISRSLSKRPTPRDLPPAGRNRMTPEELAALVANVKALNEAGVPVVVATDVPVLPGASAHLELASLVAAGLSPLQALHAAGEWGARSLGLEDRGAIAAGQRADFLLLDRDPLADIRNTRSIAAVYEGGHLVWSRKR